MLRSLEAKESGASDNIISVKTSCLFSCEKLLSITLASPNCKAKFCMLGSNFSVLKEKLGKFSNCQIKVMSRLGFIFGSNILKIMSRIIGLFGSLINLRNYIINKLLSQYHFL